MGDDKVIISRTSSCADTQVRAMERGHWELSIQPKIKRSGGGTHLGQIWRLSKMGMMMTREWADGSGWSGGQKNCLYEPFKTR